MDSVALIPSYEPNDRLVATVDNLVRLGFDRIVVVDDGSGQAYSGIFDELAAKPSCRVVRHEINRGKGAALKTGLSFIQKAFPDAMAVATIDSDGQHAPEDCCNVAAAVGEGSLKIVLGSRNFSLKSTPLMSWIGNRWASVTFGLTHGCWLPDTQTGLRAFPSAMIPFLLGVNGDRFEYEMGVLVAAARKGIPMEIVPIRTIYENGNAGTHFRPVKDAISINRLVLADFFRFAGVSFASFVLDQGLAYAFAAALAAAGFAQAGVIWLSGFIARLLSAIFNFVFNRAFVFRSGGCVGAEAWKYALLCITVIVMSNAGVMALDFLGISRGPAKFLCDTLLYFTGYRIQSKFIFGHKKKSCDADS